MGPSRARLALTSVIIENCTLSTGVACAINLPGGVPRAHTSSIMNIESIGLCAVGDGALRSIVVIASRTFDALGSCEVEEVRREACDTICSIPKWCFWSAYAQTIQIFISSSRAVLGTTTIKLFARMSKLTEICP